MNKNLFWNDSILLLYIFFAVFAVFLSYNGTPLLLRNPVKTSE